MKINNKDLSLVPFRQKVRELSRLRNGEVYHNGGVAQAEVVIGEMLAGAMSSASILSGCLKSTGYSIDIFKDILSRNNLPVEDLRILLTEPDMFKAENVALKNFLVMKGVKIKYLDNDPGVHIMVVNKKDYRAEYDISAHRALFAFENTALATEYNDVFDTLWKQALPIN